MCACLHAYVCVYVCVLQTLLELGLSPDYKDSRGLTALYHTAMVGGDPLCCELLLHEHATVCCQDENGWHEVHQVHTHTQAYTHAHILFSLYVCVRVCARACVCRDG